MTTGRRNFDKKNNGMIYQLPGENSGNTPSDRKPFINLINVERYNGWEYVKRKTQNHKTHLLLRYWKKQLYIPMSAYVIFRSLCSLICL